MRRLTGSFLAFLLMVSSLSGVAAQEAGSAYGDGIGSPATWFDDRGNAIATLEVTEVVEGWSEFEENQAADRGYMYYGVVINVTNLLSEDIEVSSHDFSMVDSMGLYIDRANVASVEDALMPAFVDEVMLAGGEHVELVLVYEMFNDVLPAMLIWEADSVNVAMVNLGDGSLETSAVVHGLNMPATSADDRGNDIASIEVTGITDDWQDFDPNQAPDRGSRYVAVDIVVTNVSADPISVNPSSVLLVDAEGANHKTTNVRVSEDVDTVLFSSSEEVAAGETVEGTLVYQVFSGVELVSVMWPPSSGMLNVVLVVDGTEGDADTGATPEVDAEATPAA